MDREIPLPLSYKVRETLDRMLHQAGPGARIPASTIHKAVNSGLDDGLPKQDVLKMLETYAILGFITLEEVAGDLTVVGVSEYYLKQNPLFLGEKISNRIHADKRRKHLARERLEVGEAVKRFKLNPKMDEAKLTKKAMRLGITVDGTLMDGISSNFTAALTDTRSADRRKTSGYGISRSEAICNAMARALAAREKAS